MARKLVTAESGSVTIGIIDAALKPIAVRKTAWYQCGCSIECTEVLSQVPAACAIHSKGIAVLITREEFV